MILSNLSDEELLRHAYAGRDPLTGTALEAELLKRFEECFDARAMLAPLTKELEDFDLDNTRHVEKAAAALHFGAEFDADTYRPLLAALADEDVHSLDDLKPLLALLAVLTEFDLDDPAALRKQLSRLAKFDQAMQDLAEPLTHLQALATTE